MHEYIIHCKINNRIKMQYNRVAIQVKVRDLLIIPGIIVGVIFPPFYLNAQHYLFYNYRLLKILFNLQIDKTQHHHDQRAT